jgi:hypothetical protein
VWRYCRFQAHKSKGFRSLTEIGIVDIVNWHSRISTEALGSGRLLMRRSFASDVDRRDGDSAFIISRVLALRRRVFSVMRWVD